MFFMGFFFFFLITQDHQQPVNTSTGESPLDPINLWTKEFQFSHIRSAEQHLKKFYKMV